MKIYYNSLKLYLVNEGWRDKPIHKVIKEITIFKWSKFIRLVKDNNFNENLLFWWKIFVALKILLTVIEIHHFNLWWNIVTLWTSPHWCWKIIILMKVYSTEIHCSDENKAFWWKFIMQNHHFCDMGSTC